MQKLLKFWRGVRLRFAAKRLGFPMKMLDRYVYGITTAIGFVAWKAFGRHCEEFGFDRRHLFPIHRKGDMIGVYELFDHRRCRGYNPLGDYAAGDSGNNGDFRLVMICRVEGADRETFCPFCGRGKHHDCRCNEIRLSEGRYWLKKEIGLAV